MPETPKKPEQLYLQRSDDMEEQKRLNERGRMASESIIKGDIGKIEAANQNLEGKWVICIGGQYPPEIALSIDLVNVDMKKVLINAGEKYEKQWVPIEDLRLLSAVSEIVNLPIEVDKEPQ